MNCQCIDDALWERRADEAVEQLTVKIPHPIEVAVVLGSGLSGYAEHISIETRLSTKDILHYPVPGVAGHHGEWVIGTVGSPQARRVLLLKGRSHLYEGKSVAEVIYYLRLLKRLSIPKLILTNAAGGIAPDFMPGDIVLISDIINFQLGYAFLHGGLSIADRQGAVRQMGPYVSPTLNALIIASAREGKERLLTGVYAAVLGPSYETPAEIQMLGRLGADLVGMSTALEAMWAQAYQMEVAGLSLVTNKAAGLSEDKLTHEDVQHVAERARERFSSVMSHILTTLTHRV